MPIGMKVIGPKMTYKSHHTFTPRQLSSDFHDVIVFDFRILMLLFIGLLDMQREYFGRLKQFAATTRPIEMMR